MLAGALAGLFLGGCATVVPSNTPGQDTGSQQSAVPGADDRVGGAEVPDHTRIGFESVAGVCSAAGTDGTYEWDPVAVEIAYVGDLRAAQAAEGGSYGVLGCLLGGLAAPPDQLQLILQVGAGTVSWPNVRAQWVVAPDGTISLTLVATGAG